MFNLFITLNVRLWWRSLKGVEIAGILFYSLFLLLVFSQFISLAFTLLFVPDLEMVKETYPWFDEDVQLSFHLLLINSTWIFQFFFTKVSRLRLNENRKLLALGMPRQKLARYSMLAGFLHPLNILFHAFWLIYLGLMTTTTLQLLVVILFVIANYSFISYAKWHIKLFNTKGGKVMNTMLVLGLFLLVIFIPSVDPEAVLQNPGTFFAGLLEWLEYTPGYLVYLFANLTSTLQIILAISGLTILSFYLTHQLISRTSRALLSPPASSGAGASPYSSLPVFKKWLGPEGGKYMYSAWNHSYTKTQLSLAFFIPAFYIFLMADETAAGEFTAALFLTFLPATFLLLLVNNLFGFENRELLLSLQGPSKISDIVKKRFISAAKVTGLSFVVAVLFIPFLFDTLAHMLQITLAIAFILQVMFILLMKNSLSNYKKIEEVGVMSLSNSVLPASVTFMYMFLMLVLGLLSFIVIEQFQWVHITILLLINFGLALFITKKLNQLEQPFKMKIIPRLWNEL